MPGFNVGKKLPGCNLQYGSDVNNILSNTIETARSNRFELSIIVPVVGTTLDAPFKDKIVTLACESISRPIVRIEKEKVHNGADYINVPLRATYEPIEVSLYEILKPTSHSDPAETKDAYNMTASEVFKWWTNGVFDPTNSRVTYPSSRRTIIEISMFSGAGAKCWTYVLYGAWPEAIIPSGLDYKTGAITKLALTIPFDKYKEVKP